jgi:hypothetical protein
MQPTDPQAGRGRRLGFTISKSTRTDRFDAIFPRDDRARRTRARPSFF